MVISGVYNHLCGTNAINIYSASILSQFYTEQTQGIYLIAFANVVGALFAPLMQKFFKLKSLLIAGQFVNAGFLIGIAVFTWVNVPIATLLCMIGVIVTY